jgi:hypothetical protein
MKDAPTPEANRCNFRKIICRLFGHKFNCDDPIGQVIELQRGTDSLEYKVTPLEWKCNRCDFRYKPLIHA